MPSSRSKPASNQSHTGVVGKQGVMLGSQNQDGHDLSGDTESNRWSLTSAEEEDLVCMKLSDMMNKNGSPFLFKRVNNGKKRDITEEEIEPVLCQPLLSSRNFHRLYIFLLGLLCKIREKKPGEHYNALISCWRRLLTSAREQKRIRNWNMKHFYITVFSMVISLLMSLVILSVVTHTAMAHTYSLMTIALLWVIPLLIDLEEIRSVAPTFVFQIKATIVKLLYWIDYKLLFGWAFSGREWDREKFLFQSQDSDHTVEKNRVGLLKNPPPGLRQILPRKTGDKINSPSEWNSALREASNSKFFESMGVSNKMSGKTKEHVSAVNFCYIMVRESMSNMKADVAKGPKKTANTDDTRQAGHSAISKKSAMTPKRPFLDKDRKAAVPKQKRAQDDIGLGLILTFSGESNEEVCNTTENDARRVTTPSTSSDHPPLSATQRLRHLVPPPEITSEKKYHTRNATPLDSIEIVELSRGEDESNTSSEIAPEGRRRSYSEPGVTLSTPEIFNNSFSSQDTDSSFDLFAMTTEENKGTTDSPTGSVCNHRDMEYDENSESPNHDLVNNKDTCTQVGDEEGRLDWIDVGAKIGIRILNSEHIQRAIVKPPLKVDTFLGKKSEDDTRSDTGTIYDTKNVLSPIRSRVRVGSLDELHHLEDSTGKHNMAPLLGWDPTTKKTQTVQLARPVHAMWTSAAAPSLCAPPHLKTSRSVGDQYASQVTMDEITDGNYKDPGTPVAKGGRAAESDFSPRSKISKTKDEVSATYGSVKENERSDTRDDISVGSHPTCQKLKQDNIINRLEKENSGFSFDQDSMSKPASEQNVLRMGDTKSVHQGVSIKNATRTSLPGDFHENLRYITDSTLTGMVKEQTHRVESSSAPLGLGMKVPHPRRPIIAAGVKMVVSIFPPSMFDLGKKGTVAGNMKDSGGGSLCYQMGTVISSKRIHVKSNNHVPHLPPTDGYVSNMMPRSPHRSLSNVRSNCLSITVQLDNSFLRGGRFAEMTFRVMDEWSDRHMPRHSKHPVGSCVATSYGIGILVAWRVEDDCHVIRSLWKPRGSGSAIAYMNRDAIHDVVEAAVGFDVETKLGKGIVSAYKFGGDKFRAGKYFVLVKERGRHKGHVIELHRTDILSCPAAKFIPVIEQIREAAQYQIQVDNYELALRLQNVEIKEPRQLEGESWSFGVELLLSSLVKALTEDKEFDVEMKSFVTSVINFLENFDGERKIPHSDTSLDVSLTPSGLLDNPDNNTSIVVDLEKCRQEDADELSTEGDGFINDVFGGILMKPSARKEISDKRKEDPSIISRDSILHTSNSQQSENSDYNAIRNSQHRALGAVRVLMRTIGIARNAAPPNRPDLKMALAMCHESLLFVKQVISVARKNMLPDSVEAWHRIFKDIVCIFGPVKERFEKIARGVAERIERHGSKTKIRLLRFVDLVLLDTRLVQSLELGEWEQCVARLEVALIRAELIDETSCVQYHQAAVYIYNSLHPKEDSHTDAAIRNGEKLAHLAKAVKLMAAPRRSFLKLLSRTDVLDIIERILVRVFNNDPEASAILNIFAFNFCSFRHLRMLWNIEISRKILMPLVDAADAEFAWTVATQIPANTKDFIQPISKLFSLGVAKFRKMRTGDLNADWLDFLTGQEAVEIIQELDIKLIEAIESFCQDIKDVLLVLPYYKTIDDDILNLVDEVDLDKTLKEAAEAIVDSDRFAAFLREKSVVAIDKFLEYLPTMSIPVERRELADGWVLTCRGKDGGDLTLSDVSIDREYLICQIMGGGNVLSPLFGLNHDVVARDENLHSISHTNTVDTGQEIEVSILDHVRELLVNAQKNGCYNVGVGGVRLEPSESPLSNALEGLPVSEVLQCGIDLWKNLEIDDDELMEIAIKDVSYQIQLEKEREANTTLNKGTPSVGDAPCHSWEPVSPARSSFSIKSTFDEPEDSYGSRFNPRRDPTVLYLEMDKLAFSLDNFLFRIEPEKRSTIFDPVFEGVGSLSIENVRLKVRVEIRKERSTKQERHSAVPVLQLKELFVGLDKMSFKFKKTGADWIINKVVTGFAKQITEIVEMNLKEQIVGQIHLALENLNAYIEVNPDLMLGLLGITIDDLEENVVWV